MTITYRAVKGTELSHNEVDANFSTLDTRTASGWADIVSDMYTRGGPSSPSINLYKGGIYLYEFNSSDTLEVFANFHIPHSYKVGTMVYPHVHFVTTSNASGVVRWCFEYTVAKRNESGTGNTFGSTTTIAVDYTIPANSADIHLVCEAPEGGGIPSTQMEVDGMILTRVYREAAHVNDTFSASVFGITCDVHIEVDRVATPSRAPNFYV